MSYKNNRSWCYPNGTTGWRADERSLVDLLHEILAAQTQDPERRYWWLGEESKRRNVTLDGIQQKWQIDKLKFRNLVEAIRRAGFVP
jgi:hypothetical protein